MCSLLSVVPAQGTSSADVAPSPAPKQPTLLPALTTPTTEVHRNPNGTFTAQIAAGPVRVPSDSSPTGWTRVDTTLSEGKSGLQPNATLAGVTFSPGGEGPMAVLDLGSRSLSLGWPGALPEPIVEGDTATYPGAFEGTDLVLQARPAGFEYSLIVRKPPTKPIVLDLPVRLDGVEASIDQDGNFQVTDDKDRSVAEANPGIMYGAGRDEATDQPAVSASVPLQIVQIDAGPALRIAPDPAFFANPDLTYPVVIDPSTDLNVNRDTYVSSDFPNQSYGSDTELKSGTYDGGTTKARSLVLFTAAPIVGTHVLSATLKLYEFHSFSCTASTVNALRVTSSWSGPTWNNQPSVGAIFSSTSVAKGYSSSCPGGWISLSGGGASGRSMTSLVQGWADGTYTNYGIEIRADSETSSQGWKKFRSSDASNNWPSLSVTYNSYPNTPTGLSPSSGSYTGTTTPSLHGKFCDPDGGKGRVNYEVRNNATGALVVSSSTTRAKVSSCTDHPWTVPSGNLQEGVTYKWRARADDDTDVSSWTAYRTFTVDTTAPSTPSISSSSHPSQSTWYSSSQTSFSASWTAATDSGSGVIGYAVAFDKNPMFPNLPAAITQTGTSFSTTIASTGVWYLHVAAQDAAGNWGQEATYVVHVGAALLSPFDGDRTQKYVTLQGQGNPSLSEARFQYRFSPSDANGWQDIPESDVTTTSNGSVSWPVSLDTDGKTPELVWNVASTLSFVDGPVEVRVRVGSSGQDASDPVGIALDQNLLGTAAAFGPGSVDLVTGNLSIPAADVGIGSLAVVRTLNSRDPAGPSGGIFGPGWISGLETASGYALLLEDTGKGTVTITTSGGDLLYFTKKSNGDYVPGAGTDPTLKLAKASGQFTLTGVSGTGTIFSKPSGASDYTPSSVSTPASASTTTIDYQVVSGVAQPTRLLDVVPDGVSSCSPMVKGCRALTFTYASSTTATGTAEADWGNYAGQISKISFTAWDPATSQMRTVDVASYLYDSNGRLRAEWDPRISPALRTRYGYDASGHVTELTPPGLNAWSITYATITGDANTGRVSTVSRPGDPSGTETTTITYQVPVSGSGAPYSMGPTSVAPWGQHDLPTDATAIFPPGHEPSGTPPSSYTWATVHYLDRNGMEVNTAASDGSGGAYVTTTEYERFGNVVRTLSAANRQRALADPSPAQTAGQLDEQSTYSADGIDLIDSYGPLHQIQLANGNVVSARRHTHYEYGQGALVHLPTTITEGAAEPGTTSDQDLRTTTTGYDSTLLQPTVTTTDAVSGGLNLTSTTAYDAVSGNVSKTIMPANPSGGDARETDYFYYRGGTGSGHSACNSTPEWSGLLCKTKPAVQPSSGNNLPVTTYTYDLFLNVATKTETVPSPSATRTTTFTHDAVGRLDTVAISGPGTSVPTVTYGYDSDTGLPTTTSTNGATITRAYDGLGRLSSYTDADSNVSSYAYDLQDRPTSLYDGKGTYALSYDQGGEHRGLLTTLQDSQAGSFGASYDADGALLAQSYPNGMTATYGYDESGAPTSLVYTKTTNCSSDCDWYADQVTSSIHGQWLSQDSSLSSQSYTYDQAGRLTGVDDTPVVEGSALSPCTRRAYAYDADSNRTSLTSWDPDASTGACNSTGSGTVRSWTYDQADRVTNSRYTFDAFGRITQVPAADGGGAQTSLSYHANDRVRTLAASGNTDTITIDAVNRVRTTMTSSATQEWHYAGEQDSPAWIAENNSGNWSRNVVGLNGMLAAIANQSGVVTLDLTNLHGDIVATASTSETATSPTSTHD